MPDHDESLIDKAKRALGVGQPDERTDVPGETDAGDRPDGWAGVPDAAEEPEFGVGLDRESMAGSGESNTGTGLDYDFERREVTDDPAAETVDAERRETGI